MPAPLVPSPLDCVGRRRFAFDRPIRHPDPNEWVLGSSSWSEVQVINAYTGREIWVSRLYIGPVSESASGILIVRLTEDLIFSQGALQPRKKRVIEMPAFEERADAGTYRLRNGHRDPGPASIVAIRLEPRPDSSLNRALLTTCIVTLVIAILSALLGAARV